MKDILKRLGVTLAIQSVFVAADQTVRTVVAHTLKSKVFKDKDQSKK